MDPGTPPFFSIITPVLNGKAFVHQYVRTLKSQSFREWEAIVIDDGSNDGTLDILAISTLGDPRFKILRNNQLKSIPGPYQARNFGIDSAVGLFICFLDIDDIWYGDKLKNQHETIILNPGCLLLFAAYFRAPSGDLSKSYIRRAPSKRLLYFFSKFANPIPMLTSCVRKDVLTGIRFPAVRHEDFIFWSHVLRAIDINNIFVSTLPLAVYRVHANSLSGNKLASVKWIWACYRRMGYSVYFSIISILARALIQFYYCAEKFLFVLRTGFLKPVIR